MSDYNNEIAYVIEIIKKATEITEWFSKHHIDNYIKNDKSPVTMADFASQIYIISKLKEHFPKDQIFAEEDEVNLINTHSEKLIIDCFKELNVKVNEDYKKLLNYRGIPSKRKWNIDPIDGTIGFQEKLSYAIGICLVEKEDPRITVIGIPDYNKKGLGIFIAEKYHGARASYGGSEFKNIHVSSQNDIKKARMCHSLHYDMPWVLQFAEKAGIRDRISLDSMKKFCLIADGSYDIYIKPIMGFEAFTWDYCPGDLLVREAGGNVTDLDEERLIFRDEKCIVKAPGIISSNGILHNKVAGIIRENFFSIKAE